MLWIREIFANLRFIKVTKTHYKWKTPYGTFGVLLVVISTIILPSSCSQDENFLKVSDELYKGKYYEPFVTEYESDKFAPVGSSSFSSITKSENEYLKQNVVSNFDQSVKRDESVENSNKNSENFNKVKVKTSPLISSRILLYKSEDKIDSPVDKKNLLSSFHNGINVKQNEKISQDDSIKAIKRNPPEIDEISESITNPSSDKIEKSVNSSTSNKIEHFLLKCIEEVFLNNTFKDFVKKFEEKFVQYNFNNHLDSTSEPKDDILSEEESNEQNKQNYKLPVSDLRNNSLMYFLEDSKNDDVTTHSGRAAETGRLFFFKGLKKVLWPVFIGIQIAKTILLALFLPSILGSIGKMVGKGISSVSGFAQPADTIDDLDFKDNTYNFQDQDNMKFNDYAYQQQPEASNLHYQTQMFDPVALNNNALSRFGAGDQKLTFINTGNGLMYKNSLGTTTDLKTTNFKVFHDIPASSLLLSNYDPFYSPLLSRLDAIFQQLRLGNSDESCREKLICLMYANPAKYAPYSNLVSAQLSRELNELRKPTSDNPDILRFFKYMRAAKDGQDGENCEQSYSSCMSFKESENPAMLTTYHDINKLVQARKFGKK